MDTLHNTPVPTKDELRQTFEIIRTSVYDGIPGVIKFDSGTPGPTLGITMLTHGNEPSGLAPLWYFLYHTPMHEILQNGSVYFVAHNIHASENYFNAHTDEESRLSRFVDINFNRLPGDVFTKRDSPAYEVRRAQELEKIWNDFDIGMDVHSTTQDYAPMIVTTSTFDKALIQGFPVETIISNLDRVIVGNLASSFFGGKRDVPSFVVEVGSHEKQESYKVAILCVLHLLQNLRMSKKHVVETVEKEYVEYDTQHSLMFPDTSYELERVFTPFEQVKKGDIVARGAGGPICAPVSGCTIFATNQRKPESIEEEVLFYLTKIDTTQTAP